MASVAARTSCARFALVDYRDFPERTGDDGDYPSKLDQAFTSDAGAITGAIDGLALGYGADWPETMNGGIYRGVPSQAAAQIEAAIDTSLDRPYAWAGGPYVGKVGEPARLDKPKPAARADVRLGTVRLTCDARRLRVAVRSCASAPGRPRPAAASGPGARRWWP